MLDRISAPDPSVASLGDDWRTTIETLGRRMWRLYLRHPWLPFVDQSPPLLGPNSLAGFEFAVHGLDDSA